MHFIDNLMRVTDTPQPLFILLSFGVSLLLVLVPPLWRVARNIITVSHEGGHALVAKLTFRKVSGIKLHTNTSGVTITKGKEYGIGAVLTTLAGYISPALMGLGLTFLIVSGHVILATFILIVLIFLMLIMIRNIWGALITIPFSVGLYYLSQQEVIFQTIFLTWLASFLIVGSVLPIIELYKQRRETNDRDNDADQLRRITLLPYHFWMILFLMITLAADFISIKLWISIII